jgi:hypothetical protein
MDAVDGEDGVPAEGPTGPWVAPPPALWRVGPDGDLDVSPSPWQHALPYLFALLPELIVVWSSGFARTIAWVWAGAAGVFLFFLMISVGCTVHVVADDFGIEVRTPPLTRRRLAWDEIDKVEVDLTRLSHTKMWVRIFVKGSQRWPRTRTVNLGYRQAKQAADLLREAARRHGVLLKINDVNPPKAPR